MKTDLLTNRISTPFSTNGNHVRNGKSIADDSTMLNALADFTFTSKYARYNPEWQRRENWVETVSRVEKMHLKRYAHLPLEDREAIKDAFTLVYHKIVLPSMRSMQFGGTAIEVKNERMFNCAATHIHSPRSFAEFMFLSLCGTGVGIGLRKKFINRLPNLVDASDKTGSVLVYTIEDNIEGWADSIEALINCYFRANPYSGRKIVFDYSKIRPKGVPLKTSGGLAPGYTSLKAAHGKIKSLLDNLIEVRRQRRLKSIDVYDILMHCADAVVSGGIRRSATIALFEPDDLEMMQAKTGDWFNTNPQRARSNNSVLLLRDELTHGHFREIIENARQFGEPGFVLVDDEDALTNPCAEVGLIPVTEDGVCGIQFCNLTTQNGSKIHTLEEWKKAIRAATIIGTLQAGYTDFKYLSVAAREITEKEALLGVSLTGWMENPKVLLDAENQRIVAEIARATNEEWAKKIGIRRAARITLIKPEGTASCVLGTASGIHPHHARKYFRRVQCNRLDPVYKHFAKSNPHMTEKSSWSANGTDDIVTFPLTISPDALVKADLSALEHLRIVRETQLSYVRPGANEAARSQHNVSCTVVVKPDEWEEVTDYLYTHRKDFCAVSLLGASGDKDYIQAPMEAVTTVEDEMRFAELSENYAPVNYALLREREDGTNFVREVACTGGTCEL
jgi:ribonucleoside-triphosphate reductase (thioredoxin)